MRSTVAGRQMADCAALMNTRLAATLQDTHAPMLAPSARSHLLLPYHTRLHKMLNPNKMDGAQYVETHSCCDLELGHVFWWNARGVLLGHLQPSHQLTSAARLCIAHMHADISTPALHDIAQGSKHRLWHGRLSKHTIMSAWLVDVYGVQHSACQEV